MEAPTDAGDRKSWISPFLLLRREVLAGVPFAFALLPTCLTSALLAFAPLGPDYVARGATLGLYAIIFGGTCTALFATSSFIVYSPRSNLALIQAAGATYFLTNTALSGNPEAVIIAMAVCVFLAGILQVLFALLGIAKIAKYTPHPVMAGFTNGVALTIVWSQLRPFIDLHSPGFIRNPTTLAFIVLMAAFIFALDKMSRKIPTALAGLAVGILVFYGLGTLVPNIDLGRTIGNHPVAILPTSPLSELGVPEIEQALLASWHNILFVSFAIAVIAIFETLLVYRAAQALADRPIGSVRDAVALGIGNCASAGVGGIAFSAALGQTQSVYREGGRTRVVPVTIGLVILGLTTGAPALLGAIPIAAISALLVQNTLRRIDMWSVRLFAETLRSPPSPQRRRAWFDLAVVAVVMGVTIAVSVVPGVLAGVVVAGVIFIADMSRPVVRRRHSGRSIMSKRRRRAHDLELLRETGDRRVVVELGGVLFFGNADDLSHTVSELFAEADTIILDLNRVADIDVSGATILRNLVERSRKRRKDLSFCNVPPVFADTLDKIAGTAPSSVFPDRDAALEWAEEKVLQAHAESRAMPSVLSPEQHDFLRGLDCSELAVLVPYLKRRDFRIGDILCQEGDPADRMWLLMKGNVSIRLRSPERRSGRRIAGCATGTTVGEMAVIDGGFRSANVVADDDLVCYELEYSAFERILQDHPALASKLLTNLARALAQRVRSASEELREVAN